MYNYEYSNTAGFPDDLSERPSSSEQHAVDSSIGNRVNMTTLQPHPHHSMISSYREGETVAYSRPLPSIHTVQESYSIYDHRRSSSSSLITSSRRYSREISASSPTFTRSGGSISVSSLLSPAETSVTRSDTTSTTSPHRSRTEENISSGPTMGSPLDYRGHHSSYQPPVPDYGGSAYPGYPQNYCSTTPSGPAQEYAQDYGAYAAVSSYAAPGVIPDYRYEQRSVYEQRYDDHVSTSSSSSISRPYLQAVQTSYSATPGYSDLYQQHPQQPPQYHHQQQRRHQPQQHESHQHASPSPPPAPPSPPPQLSYVLRIRQQPIAARACGFGERDRRVIDPPPIIDLRTFSLNTNEPATDPTGVLALHCTLINAYTDADETDVPTTINPGSSSQHGPSLPARRLMGTLVASPNDVKDDAGVPGTFFVFPDLSCRMPGHYRLRFRLMRVNPERLRPGMMFPCMATCVTEVFQVFTAKDFPGMKASSALLKALRLQGVIVGVKKGSEASGRAGRERKAVVEDKDDERQDEEGDDDESDEEDDVEDEEVDETYGERDQGGTKSLASGRQQSKSASGSSSGKRPAKKHKKKRSLT